MNEMIWFSRINSNHVEVKFELLSWQKKISHFSFLFLHLYLCLFLLLDCLLHLIFSAGSVENTHMPQCLQHWARESPHSCACVSVSRWPRSPALQPYFGFSVHNCFTNRETLQSVAGHYMQTHVQIIDPLPSKLQKCLSDL